MDDCEWCKNYDARTIALMKKIHKTKVGMKFLMDNGITCMSSSPSLFFVLFSLIKNQSENMSQLSKDTGLPMSTVTGIVDKLVAEGSATRKRDESDRRIINVELTADMRKRMQRAHENACTVFDSVVKSMGDEEISAVERFFDLLLYTIEREK